MFDSNSMRSNPEFLIAIMQMLSADKSGVGTEFYELTKLIMEFSELMEEYSKSSKKHYKRLKQEHIISEKLYKLLSNRRITEDEMESVDDNLIDELDELNKMYMRGEIVRTELFESYKQAIVLKRKVIIADIDLLPAIFSKYELPQEMQTGIELIVTSMIRQLEEIILQATL